MFRWGNETEAMVTDLACIEDLTIQEVANRVGASLSAVKKFYRSHRDEIETARASMLVSDRVLTKVLDLWWDGVEQVDIAVAVNLPLDTIRRLILCAQYDEEAPREADYELAALQSAHPDRLYEDHVDALTEYGKGWVRPRFLLAADCVTPLAEETARYRVDQTPERKRVTLAAAA